MHTQKQEEREKSDRITWSPFPSTPWKNLSFEQTLEPMVREIIETVQVRKEHEGFEKISKRSKRGLKPILVLRCYHAVALLSG